MSGGGNGVGRFYRSRLFWLGVPGLVFLLGVWWESGARGTFVNWAGGKRLGVVWVKDGALGWEDTLITGPGYAVADFSVLSEDGSPRVGGEPGCEFLMPRALVWERSDDADETSRSLEVAMWVVVLAYGVMWLGAVWWWQRRKARVVRSAE